MKKIMLDAGHGLPPDPGATGNGLREADLTIDLVDRISTKLAPYDVEVLHAPRTDLKDRTDAANAAGVDFYLSIHVNAGGGTGFESYIHPAAGVKTKQHQDIIHKTVAGYFTEHGLPDRGMKQKNFHVLRETMMSALLLENGFIDHPRDAELLKKDSFLDGLANAIAGGLIQVLGLKREKEGQLEKRIRELELENSKLRAQLEMMRQEMKQVCGICCKYEIS